METQKNKQNKRNSQGRTSQKMRIMVFDFHSKMLIESIKILQDSSIEILYWTGSKKDFTELSRNKKLFPNTIFHDADDAASAIPVRGIDVSSFAPVGKDLAKLFFECELQSLIMMEGIDRTNIPFIKKVHIYYKYLKYWHGVLATLKPDAIIFSDAPHMSFKYVAYCLGKHLGIKQAMLRNTKIGGRMFIEDDVTDYKKLRIWIKNNQDKNFTIDDLDIDIRDYYKKQQNIDKSPFYFRKEHVKKRTHGLFRFFPRALSVAKNIRHFTLFKTVCLYIQMHFLNISTPSLERFIKPVWVVKLQERGFYKIKQGFKKEYERYQIMPDFSKKYIYIPLQRQPERSTLSEGDIFVDQILMIDILSYVIPKDWIIYVKENYMQWVLARTQAGRFKGFTEEIVQRKNVFVVPAETSTFDLIRNSQAVATVTGTAAWEAVLRGKPAIVFGYVWYMYCDGVFSVVDAESCQRAVEKIINGFIPDQQKIINFLKAFNETTILAYRNVRWRDGDDLNITLIKNDKENIKNIADGFYRELMK